MGQCKYCGKKSFFLSVDKDGLCKNCAPVLLMQVKQIIRIIKESENIINKSKNPNTILSRYDTILTHLKSLMALEQKGLTPMNQSPTALFHKVTEEKNKMFSADSVNGKQHVEDRAEDNFENRVICSDGNCIGIIGLDGQCNVCGKPYKEDDYDGVIDDYDEAIDGYEFIATLSPTTPLKALNHHLEKVRRIPETKLPNYGDGRDGIWLAFFDDDNYSKPPSKAELRELEFLRKFREAYESDLSHDRKHEIISDLFEVYRDLSQQISHAAEWYLWELFEISGISESIVELLYFEGIKSKKDVKIASDKKLLNIPGIGPGRLKQIRAYFSSSKNN